jgi:hypothetical protein
LVKKEFLQEQATPDAVDIIVAAGADEDGNVPANVVRDDAPPTIIRPAPSGRWMTLVSALQELGL